MPYSTADIGGCCCGTAAVTCGTCAVPGADLTVSWTTAVGPLQPAGSAILTYSAAGKTWTSPCLAYGAVLSGLPLHVQFMITCLGSGPSLSMGAAANPDCTGFVNQCTADPSSGTVSLTCGSNFLWHCTCSFAGALFNLTITP